MTAEGVETADAARALADMGCELGQGYGMCRPVSADSCAQVVRELTPAAPKLRSVSGSA